MNMGYIGPITPFDYIQYANRTVEAARKKKKIQAVSMVPTVQSYVDESKWIGKLCKRTGQIGLENHNVDKR